MCEWKRQKERVREKKCCAHILQRQISILKYYGDVRAFVSINKYIWNEKCAKQDII